MSSTESPLRPDTGTVRRHELQPLVTSLDRLPHHRGLVAEVAGGMGSGKSRLLAEFAAEAHARDVPVLHARGTGYGRNTAFHVVVTALQNDLVAQRLSHLSADDAASLHRVLHAPADFTTATTDPKTECSHASSYHLRLLLRHVTHDGLVIILDDMHLADPQSLTLIDQLISSPLDVPLFVVIAHRPRQAPPQLRGSLAHGLAQGTVQRIALPALNRGQCAAILGVRGEDPWLRDLYRESEGNPLYLLAAAHGGDRGTTGSAAFLEPTNPSHPVDDVQNQYAAHLLAEIAALSGVEALVLRSAAVLGDRFDLAAVAAVAELDLLQVCAAADRLVRRDLLRVVEAGARCTFRHPVLRRLVYTESDACRRLHAHRNALAVLVERQAPAAEQAPHIEQSFAGENGRDTVATLIRAADEVLRSSPRRAAQWLRFAGSVIDRDPAARDQRAAVLAKSAQAWFLQGKPDISRELLHEALVSGSANSVDDRVRLIRQCTMIDLFVGNHARAWTLLTSELAALPRPCPGAGVLMVLRAIMSVIGSGQWPSPDELRTALELTGSGGGVENGALALYGLHEVVAGNRAAGTRMIRDCATRLDHVPDGELVGSLEALPLLAWAEIFLGRFAEAQRHIMRGLRIAHDSGEVYLLPILIDGLCHVSLFVGPMAGAEPVIAEAYAVGDRIDSNEIRGLALTLRALEASWTGAHDTARTLAEQGVAALQPGSLWRVSAALALARATLFGEPRRSRMLVLDAGRGPDLHNLPAILRPMCHHMLTTAAIAADDADAAFWARRAREAVRGSELPCQHAEALLAEAEVARFAYDLDAASELFQQAADRLAAADLVLPRIRALVDAAECAAEAGRPEDAAPLLVLARELARRSGTDALYRRAEEHLGALAWDKGPAPDRGGGTSALSALTDRQREIAGLAGTGMRTREIAEALRLSPRTVDAHLANIYRRLDLSSRAELAHLVTGIQGGPVASSTALGLSKCGP